MTQTDDLQSGLCESAIEQYVLLAKVHAQAVLNDVGIDLDSVLADALDKNMSGLWEDLIGDPMQLANAAIKEAFGFDPKLAAEGTTTLSDAGKGLFQAGTWLPALEPITDSYEAVLEAYQMETQGDDATMSHDHKKKSPFYQKSVVGSPCASNQLAASAAAVVSQTAHTIDSAFSGIIRAQLVTKSSMANIAGFTDGLFAQAVGVLNSYYSVEVDLLEQIQKTAIEIQEELKEIDTSTVSSEHDAVIRLARYHLSRARLAFSRVGNNFLAGKGFSEENYNTGQDLLKEAEDVVSGTKLNLEFDTAPYKLLAKVQLFLSLRSAWLRQQRLREDVKLNLTLFDEDFSTDFNNLFAPFIDYLRCRIEFLISDMSATIGTGNQLKYLAKEKAWWLGIKTLRETSNVIEKVLDVLGEPITFSLDLSKSLQTTYNNHQNTLIGAKAFDETMQDFIERTYEVLMDPKKKSFVAQAKGGAVVALATYRINLLTAQKGAGEEYLSADAVKVLETLSAVNQYTEYISGVGYNVVNQVASGNLKALWELDALSATIGQQVFISFAKLKNCLVGQDTATEAAAASVTKELSDGVAADGYADALESVSADDRLAEVDDKRNQIEEIDVIAKAQKKQAFDVDLIGTPVTASAATALDLDQITPWAAALVEPDPAVGIEAYGTIPEVSLTPVDAVAQVVPEPVTESALLTYEVKPVWWADSEVFPLEVQSALAYTASLSALKAALYQHIILQASAAMLLVNGVALTTEQGAELHTLTEGVIPF